jgi:hypothetical protein
MSIEEEVFEVLHQNLVSVKPEYNSRNIILCPICLSEIYKDEVLEYGIEHIIPKIIVKNDAPEIVEPITKNQRSGLTVLCRQPRFDRKHKLANNGCNGLKGSLYDWSLGRLFKNKTFNVNNLFHRHYVGVLVMGYLAAFQIFGYEYILRSELDEIRKQFDYPDDTKTDWLRYVRITEPSSFVFTGENGMPFLVGGLTHNNAALEIMFRNFWVVLPSGHQSQNSFTRNIEMLLCR